MTQERTDRIGDWVPERLLGRGATAAVYLCRTTAGAPVAVKWMDQAHPAGVRRFQREIESLRRLNHPGIVRVLDHGDHLGRPFYVMEHIDGTDLRLYADKLQQRPASERYARCRTIGRALAEVLGHLHERGLVHRDVKPSNVIVAADGRIVLTDFGVVKDLAEDDRTQAGLMIGTPAYAAPEQVEGELVDARADLFGLGATLYFVLTARLPFDGRDRGPSGRPSAPSDHDPGIPADLEAVILRLMAPQREHRFPDAPAAALALAAGSGGGVPVAGRAEALQAAAGALERAREGVGVHVRPHGPRGAGKGWLSDMLRQGGRRRGIAVFEARTESEAGDALERLEAGEAIVLVSPLDLDLPEDTPRIDVHLRPLGVADVRRTVVATAPLTADPAQVAERVHRATGGLPGLMVPLLQRSLVGQRVQLPEGDLVLPDIASDWLEGLGPDEQEVLWALAMAPAPVTPTLIEEVVHVPPEAVLADLQDRGLVLSVGKRWHVSAGAFRAAALDACWDPDGMGARVQEALARRTGEDPPLDETLEAVLPKGDGIAAAGRLAAAQALAVRAAGTARAIGHREQECAALCLLGQVLLDLGQSRLAGRRLADATALARATEQPVLRRLSHALRAQAVLVARRANRTACSSALDRLIPITTSARKREPDYADALAFAGQAWAAAALGDARSAERARATSRAALPALSGLQAARVRIALAQGAAAAKDEALVEALVAELEETAAGWPLLVWQARRVRAAVRGEDPSPPGAYAEGLAPEEAEGLAAWP